MRRPKSQFQLCLDTLSKGGSREAAQEIPELSFSKSWTAPRLTHSSRWKSLGLHSKSKQSVFGMLMALRHGLACRTVLEACGSQASLVSASRWPTDTPPEGFS